MTEQFAIEEDNRGMPTAMQKALEKVVQPVLSLEDYGTAAKFRLQQIAYHLYRAVALFTTTANLEKEFTSSPPI